jgi:hypothetical protein
MRYIKTFEGFGNSILDIIQMHAGVEHPVERVMEGRLYESLEVEFYNVDFRMEDVDIDRLKEHLESEGYHVKFIRLKNSTGIIASKMPLEEATLKWLLGLDFDVYERTHKENEKIHSFDAYLLFGGEVVADMEVRSYGITADIYISWDLSIWKILEITIGYDRGVSDSAVSIRSVLNKWEKFRLGKTCNGNNLQPGDVNLPLGSVRRSMDWLRKKTDPQSNI